MLTGPQPIRAVLFDFHSTLIDQGSSEDWIEVANRRLAGAGRSALVPASLATFLDHVWERARVVDPAGDRDRSAAGHRAVFARLLADVPGVADEMVDALYATLTSGWRAYAEVPQVLRDLRAFHVRIAVVSNTGFDIRPVLEAQGLLHLLDAVVLSLEVGHVKPDPVIFRAALDAIRAVPESTLMVGDSPHDDNGAADLGIRTLILPRTSGAEHGLQQVTALVASSSRPVST